MIAARQAQLDSFHKLIWPPKAERPRVTVPPRPVDLDDQELLAKARAARNGAKFSRAYDGDSSDWRGDESRGDLYLAGELLWWTNGDRPRAEQLFENSGRMRPKWFESRGTQTYGARTFDAAEERFRGGYQPHPPTPTLEPTAPVPVILSTTLPAPGPGPDAGDAEESDAVQAITCSSCPYATQGTALEAENAALLAHIHRLENENQDLTTRLENLHETHAAVMETYRDANLKQSASTAVVLAKEAASQVSRGADQDGWVRMTLGPTPNYPGISLAEQTGRSGRRVSPDLKRFEQLGWLELRHDHEQKQRVDPQTGEITQQMITVLRVRLPGAEQGTAALLANLRERCATTDTPKKQWGGARPRCPDHPQAALVERREVCCAHCGKVLAFRERPYHPGELEESPVDPAERPETWPELQAAGPTRQDDDYSQESSVDAADRPGPVVGEDPLADKLPPQSVVTTSLRRTLCLVGGEAEADVREAAPHLVLLPDGHDDGDVPELGGLYRVALEAEADVKEFVAQDEPEPVLTTPICQPNGQGGAEASATSAVPCDRGNHGLDRPMGPMGSADGLVAQPRLLVLPPELVGSNDDPAACHCRGSCVCVDGATGPPPGPLGALHACSVPGCSGLTQGIWCPRHVDGGQRGEAS
jgi:hypothetical protein